MVTGIPLSHFGSSHFGSSHFGPGWLAQVELFAQVAMSSDCEWMFGDAATGAVGFNELSHLNPFRWSGPISFGKGISDLEEVLKVDSRAILLKVPPGVYTNSQHFGTTEEAITYLKTRCPAELARRQDAEKSANEAVKVASATKDAAEAAVAAAREEVAAKEQMVMQAKTSHRAASDALEAARAEQKKATTRLNDAQANAAEVQARLESATAQASSAAASLEDAHKRAVQAKAELDEMASPP